LEQKDTTDTKEDLPNAFPGMSSRAGIAANVGERFRRGLGPPGPHVTQSLLDALAGTGYIFAGNKPGTLPGFPVAPINQPTRCNYL
jgi:hypothetical protein